MLEQCIGVQVFSVADSKNQSDFWSDSNLDATYNISLFEMGLIDLAEKMNKVSESDVLGQSEFWSDPDLRL